MNPRIVTLSLLSIFGALGCYAVEEPAQKDELSSIKGEIESALPDSASVVWQLSPHERPNALRSITWPMRDGGSLLVPYYRDIAKAAPTSLPVAVYLAPDGQMTPLLAEDSEAAAFSVSGNAPPPAVTPCGKEAVIRICDAGDSTLWVTNFSSGTIHRSEAALGDCESSIFGKALEGERFVTIRSRADSPLLTEWSCTGGEIHEASEPKPLPWMPALPRWVEEVEPSVHAFMRHQPGTGEIDFGDWVYERSDGIDPVRIPRTELPLPSDFEAMHAWERIRREPSGALLVDAIAGMYRWHVTAGGQLEKVENLPAPSPELSDWEHVGFGTAISRRVDWNPNGGQLEMPLEYEILRSTSEGFQSFAAPTTPCVTREACRRIGESYLRGLVETAKGPLGLYVLWTWQRQPVPYGETTATSLDLATLILAPLERPLP